jgi:hypothetical protein
MEIIKQGKKIIKILDNGKDLLDTHLIVSHYEIKKAFNIEFTIPDDLFINLSGGLFLAKKDWRKQLKLKLKV